MKHMGDIKTIHGGEVPTVDVVIGGSPCQDLSIAGRREGLAGDRSGLFLEQVRIVKEMREHDRRNGRPAFDIRPRFMVWENVPGAFTSNGGKDFRAVLSEIARIAQPDAPDVPLFGGGGAKRWPVADAYFGNGWSIAYRVFDAQFWGVPQRRRRIALVADFGGYAAPEILFIRESLPGHLGQEQAPGQAAAAADGGGANPAIAVRMRAGCDGGGKGALIQVERSGTLRSGDNEQIIFTAPAATAELRETYRVTTRPHSADEAPTIEKTDVANTLNAFDVREARAKEFVVSFRAGAGAKAGGLGIMEDAAPTLCAAESGTNSVPVVMATGQARAEIMEDAAPTLNCNHEQPIVFDKEVYASGANATGGHYISDGGPAPTLRATWNPPGCEYGYTVRRLTPVECERLQGFPDGWTDIGPWTDRAGRLHKESSDSARYKALGNSFAIPPWKWVLKRVAAQYERDATLASLFDGIGAAPLIWEQINGKGSCLWASEIEDFPIAVTKYHFPDE